MYLMRNPARAAGGWRWGAATAELALVLPVLIFLLVIAVDFARLFYQQMVLTNCARNGALWESDPPGQAESPYANFTEAALADASGLTPAPSVTRTYSTAPGGPYDQNSRPAFPAYVEVRVTWNFQPVMPVLLGTEIPLEGKARMRIAPNAPS
jgi:Flp pilus assembly protein TadG